MKNEMPGSHKKGIGEQGRLECDSETPRDHLGDRKIIGVAR